MTDAYPVVVPTAFVRQPITSLRRAAITMCLALALLAAGCSGSEEASGNLVPVDAPAQGVIYTTTSAGDLQLVTADTGAAKLLISAQADGQSALVDLAPATSGGLYALVQDPVETFKVGVAELTGSGLETIETSAELVACLDPQHEASTAIAHEVGGGGASGTAFTPVLFAGGDLGDNSFDLTSVACPRWTADRDVVVTAIAVNATDPSSIVTVVQTSSGERHEIGFAGCGTTPTSISPDDQFLVVAITCFSALWENSGLYLVPLDDVAEPGDLDALAKLGGGLYGRTSWHPDGAWLAAVHADAIENQNVAQDLSTQRVGLQLIEVDTLQIVDVALVDDAAPFSVAWLDTEFSS